VGVKVVGFNKLLVGDQLKLLPTITAFNCTLLPKQIAGVGEAVTLDRVQG
jgi:hypothetical protein